MASLSTTTQNLTLEIPPAKVNGPLNLAETLLSGQTSEPEWSRNGDSFTDVEVLSGTPVKYMITQLGDNDDFSLRVRATIAGSCTPDEAASDLEKHLSSVLGLGDDLPKFYQRYAKEDNVLSSTFRNLRGLRLMRSTDLYEALISSILSQNNSVRLWNRSVRLMMKCYGRKVEFPDGSREFLFPRPETLAKLKPRELRSRTSMGYRAKPVVKVSRMVLREEVELARLAQEPYEVAMEQLLELPGVGPKVADCFLLYGAGQMKAAPVDIWIHRIVSKLYLRKKKVSRLKTAEFLRERFRQWAGYAQLYLFDYARTGKF